MNNNENKIAEMGDLVEYKFEKMNIRKIQKEEKSLEGGESEKTEKTEKGDFPNYPCTNFVENNNLFND